MGRLAVLLRHTAHRLLTFHPAGLVTTRRVSRVVSPVYRFCSFVASPSRATDPSQDKTDGVLDENANGGQKHPAPVNTPEGNEFQCLCQPSSSSAPQPEATVSIHYELGLPLLTLPLPSRQEPCQFALRPLSDTVGTLCDNLHQEDKGLDYVAVYNTEGVRISVSTSIEHLLQFGAFRLRMNDKYYEIVVPPYSKDLEMSSDRLRQLDDIRATVATLHATLCVDEYKLARERQLILRLERAEDELRPLQEEKLQIERECEVHSDRIMWGGFAAMGIQTGIFAQLTWHEYSWDIMEPITYFATYTTVISTLGYYLYTKQSFDYPACKERLFTKAFYKRAKKHNFDIERYNELVTEVETIRGQLRRIRDPLFQHLPVSYLSRLENDRKL